MGDTHVEVRKDIINHLALVHSRRRGGLATLYSTDYHCLGAALIGKWAAGTQEHSCAHSSAQLSVGKGLRPVSKGASGNDATKLNRAWSRLAAVDVLHVQRWTCAVTGFLMPATLLYLDTAVVNLLIGRGSTRATSSRLPTPCSCSYLAPWSAHAGIPWTNMLGQYFGMQPK